MGSPAGAGRPPGGARPPGLTSLLLAAQELVAGHAVDPGVGLDAHVDDRMRVGWSPGPRPGWNGAGRSTSTGRVRTS